jgi:aminoglycoside 6-adenylyltransferase
MRSEQEMLDLIIGTARDDDRIRAVIMNGSRANPNAPRDRFQDFDIVYAVTDVAPFWHNLAWIDRFGERMILQLPEDMQDPPPSRDGGFAYLMQFMDGNRIDLGIYPIDIARVRALDSLSILLLDKDGCIGPLPPPSECDYLPRPPTAKAFADCCNEFWWVCPYVAKGLWRGEFLHARYMLDEAVRAELMQMLTWYIGVQTDFAANPGKYGKYFQRYLTPAQWALLLQTFAGGSDAQTWDALAAMGRLFREVARQVAAHFGFDYPMGDDERVSGYVGRRE